MKNLFPALFFLFTFSIQAQTYTIGTGTITYTDPARANRAVGVDFRYPGTNGALATGQFPFVIFAHGFSMDQTPYYPYADSLVKHGYIVGLLTTETGFSPSHANFAQDLLFVYSKLISEGSSNNASIFYQHVVAKGAIGGHSMGGGSTVLSAQYGNPEVCCFTFSAATTNPSSITSAHLMTKPYLSFAGSSDCIAPIATNQQPMYDSSGSPCKFLINITGGLHCQYGNANVACSFGEGASGCASSSLTRQQQIDKTLFHLIPFLDYYLKGDCNAWTVFETRYTSNTVDAKQRNCTNTIPANPSISGNNYFCSGNSTTLTANPAGFQYVWNDNSTGTTLSANAVGTYSVIVGNGTCALAAVSVSVSQSSAPNLPSAISTSDTVCSAISNINISVTNDASVSQYNWILPNGWNITTGTGTNAITVTSGTSGGTISVTAENNCGITLPVTKTITVVPSNLGTPGTISGSALLCSATTAAYSINPVAGANAYTWSTPNGWSVISLNPDTAIVYTTGDTSGTITVSAVNGCGQSIPSSIYVTVHSVPSLGILYGQDSVCLNSYFPLNFSLSAANDADSIFWSATSPWVITGGQGSSVLGVNSYMTSGSVSVYATNECGSTTTVTFPVVYVDTPAITIAQHGDTLSASATGSTGYQWYNSGALISGANTADYAPKASGDYTVSITNQYGCSTQSAPFSFIFSGVNTLSGQNNLQLYPNPNANGKLQISITEEWIGGKMRIINAEGRTMMNTELRMLNNELDLSALSKAIYLVQIEKNGNMLRRKLVKQ